MYICIYLSTKNVTYIAPSATGHKLTTVRNILCYSTKFPATAVLAGTRTDLRDRGPGGISSEDVPAYARSAFVHNAIVRSLSHGEVT